MPNERGQYGARPPGSSGHSVVPWILAGGALAAIGVTATAYHRARPPLTAHEREVRAWEREFPGLPWYMDQVKSASQLDTWERARDYWERTHG